MSSSRLPVHFISHGGGPWPWLKKEMPFYDKLEEALKEIPRELACLPKGIVVITAHWEEDNFTISANSRPPMLYDYGGFPKHTYEVKYEAEGDEKVAKKIQKMVEDQGIKLELDYKRGFDHGTFVPLFVMYPNANIPIIQISIKKGYDPKEHIDFGKALAPLRNENILIIGSGLSYHNIQGLAGGTSSVTEDSKLFDNWLQNSLINRSAAEREAELINWAQAPCALAAHPTEDHLVPLFVTVGAAEQSTASLKYHEENFFNKVYVSGFRFKDC
jgi:aromatic ring-opening dioxygenase catalytic subunit (LigB family)